MLIEPSRGLIYFVPYQFCRSLTQLINNDIMRLILNADTLINYFSYTQRERECIYKIYFQRVKCYIFKMCITSYRMRA